ncbi:hypothetical protein O3G_MSEX009386 [Manduca sexta]|uniref:C2H2-type domain-containing protein n=1 Tax=Manduca sexta TaxID=7130 RepID=A0A921ZE97_MANSE|nr:hypothetical protein O3G_MSEX009386 [Manduca sexta]
MMAHVMVLDSVNEDIFVCGNCKSVYNSLPCYLEHKRLSCNRVLIEDQLATVDSLEQDPKHNFVNKSESELSQGEAETSKDISRDNEQTCKICFQKFNKSKSLFAHTRLHKYKSYQCPICGRCFTQNSHLQRHKLSHRVWPTNIAERTPTSLEMDLSSYSCPYCKHISPNYKKFRIHMRCHYSLKQYKCIQDGCLNFYENINALLSHVSEVHPTPVYTCHMCHEKFDTLDDIVVHQQNHSEFVTGTKVQSKQYKCPQCEAKFRHPEKLSLHMSAESHNNICIHCNKTFASEKRLRLHLQIHRESKPFVCNICGNGFNMKKYLTTHMLKHGTKNFQCLICKTKFGRQDMLQRHLRLHQSKKMYPCPFKDTLDCKKEFSRLDKLKAHLKYHTKCISNLKDESSTSCSEKLKLPLDSRSCIK